MELPLLLLLGIVFFFGMSLVLQGYWFGFDKDKAFATCSFLPVV